MLAISIFEIKDAKENKAFNFFAWTYEYDFWRVFGYLGEASNRYNFAMFFKI